MKEQTQQADSSVELEQPVSAYESEAEQSTVSEESFAQEESSSAPAEPVPTIATDKTEYASDEQIRAMLKDYPNVFFFTGHTHWTLESTQPILAGKGADATFVNAASVGYLWNDLDAATGGSEGYCVEVYEDYVLLRGREFLYGEWCGAAQFLIPITK